MCVFFIMSRSILLTLRNISDKFVQKIKTRVLCSITFFFPSQKSCHLVDNVEKYCTASQATDDKRAHAHCMLEHPSLQTYTLSEYAIFIAFPIQQWLQERASMLSYSTSPVLFFSIGSTRALGRA